MKFLQDTAYVIVKPLIHIINCSLQNGTVPDSFKQDKVIHILESCAYDIFDNHSPISVLPTVSKILERSVHNQLMEHLESHALSICQYGFRKNINYMNLCKAFDTISHSTLINKLPDFGITNITQQWLFK